MDDSRGEILDKIRRSRGWLPEAKTLAAALASGAGNHGLTAVELAQRFALEARKIDAEVFEDPTPEAALERLLGLLKDEHVLAWDLDHVDRGVLASASASLEFGKSSDRSRTSLGLTGCDMAIAETGSLVLVAGPGQNREASLICRTHVALVRPSDVVTDLAEALARVDSLGERRAHINIVSGPSRTADIEMTLTRGVHGPKRLVILVADWPRLNKGDA
ncbi:MAG: lactate utilization protein [candidate division FCPU426 bacterium]